MCKFYYFGTFTTGIFFSTVVEQLFFLVVMPLIRYLCKKYDCELKNLNEKLTDLDASKELNQLYLASNIDGPLKNVEVINSTPENIHITKDGFNGTLKDYLREKWARELKYPQLFVLWDKHNGVDRYHPLELVRCTEDYEWDTSETLIEFLCSYFLCEPKDINYFIEDPDRDVDGWLEDEPFKCKLCGPIKTRGCDSLFGFPCPLTGFLNDDEKTGCYNSKLKYPDLIWFMDKYNDTHPLELVSFDTNRRRRHTPTTSDEENDYYSE